MKDDSEVVERLGFLEVVKARKLIDGLTEELQESREDYQSLLQELEEFFTELEGTIFTEEMDEAVKYIKKRYL